jgi:nucleoside-diphosphate-sugar epimerase
MTSTEHEPEPGDHESNLTVAVTGPTGTFGFGLMPRLQSDPRIARIVGVARRPFDPAEHGWTKMQYRRGDVRDATALEQAFEGADVVVHLAFSITGGSSHETTRAINIDGTLRAFEAAAASGARRFVYASSVAAYGFHPDNPIGMTEDWPVRPATHLFYAQEKADLEHRLGELATEHPDLGLYLLRPPIVLGPHAVGAKEVLPPSLERLGHLLGRAVRRVPVPFPVAVPVPAPSLLVQFIHEDDVGQAFVLCIVGAGPPGAYNISGDGVLTGSDLVRELGLTPVPIPARPIQAVARALASFPSLPFGPPATEWMEAFSHPAILDSSKAKRELGWEPRFTSAEALRETLRRRD